jgi:hypothetical protein
MPMKVHKSSCLSLLMLTLIAFSLSLAKPILGQEKPPEKPLGLQEGAESLG